MITLGIETSCDETALALIETDSAWSAGGHQGTFRVIASLVHSQAELHSAYGGVFPSLAKREHGKNLLPLLHKLIIEADGALATRAEITADDRTAMLERFKAEIAPQNPELYESFAGAPFLGKIPNIDRIAVTEGPGLEPALWVGLSFARMLSDAWGIPVVPVDHMEGHIVGSLVPSDAPNGAPQRLLDAAMPSLAFLISGGHTELVRVASIGGPYEIVGETVDDAVGEAFDKTARLLGLPYPGGIEISMLSARAREEGIAAPLKLPRPMIGSKDLAFSFSGLKTAVLYATRVAPRGTDGQIDAAWKKGLAREFQDAVTETLSAKLRSALDLTGARSLIVGGGVAANHQLREAFAEIARERSIGLFMPSRHLSGDNALMIAVAGSLSKRADAKARSDGRLLRARGTKRLGSES